MTTAQAPEMVRITLHQPTASGGRKGFHKTVRSIDDKEPSAYAFLGDFIPSGREIDLPRHSIIVRKTPHGSVRNDESLWSWARTPDDGLSWEWSQPINGRQFLSFRDQVHQALQENRQRNGAHPATGDWLLRPGETVPNPQAAPPKESAILTGYQLFAALAQAAAQVDFNPAQNRFNPKNRQAGPIARDANRFMDAIEARCPAALAGRLGWNGQQLTLQASREAIFLAIYGLDETLLAQAAQTRPAPGRAAKPQTGDAIQQILKGADTEVDQYREEAWRTAARNLQELGLKLYRHPLNLKDTRIVFT